MEAYDVAKFALNALFRSIWRMRVEGAEHIPLNGPLIIACNHVSYFDPPVLGSAAPRTVSYMAKSELFAVPLLGPAIALVHAFPVERGKGDVAAIRTAVKVIERGGCVGIFPEGGRVKQGEERPAQVGVALLAYLSRARVVPAAILGTDSAAHLATIRVHFGEPMEFHPAVPKATREELTAFSGEVLARIKALREG